MTRFFEKELEKLRNDVEEQERDVEARKHVAAGVDQLGHLIAWLESDKECTPGASGVDFDSDVMRLLTREERARIRDVLIAAGVRVLGGDA